MQSLRFFVLLSFVAVLGGVPKEVSAVPIGILDSHHSYVGSIGYVDDRGQYTTYSGRGSGVLIAPDVILTAGHVAEITARDREVAFVTGNDLASNGVESLTWIESAVFHPLYDPHGMLGSFDIALLFLSAPVELDDYAVLAPFAPETLVGEEAAVVGYGGGWQRKTARGAVAEFLDDELIVLEDGFVESGDSGGGLFVERDGQAVLAGITSWEMAPWGYGGFEPVAYARSFIDDYVPGAVWYGESVPVSVPEPGTLVLLLVGLAGIAVGRAGQKQQRTLLA